ncbi:Tetratricopeptide repeat-containing protein [Granulicella pectinivorans]|uniref:Tetratricopeptide repeat-containing protein n=1 Tax=Granulicella pectinivorans TaxID=474950 RepID=A0A1I6MZ97_9BACT|nr:carboxypeptidase-like regulatory domain-containing protein [Granulicella pectinivorans]SFS20921.1 Tetratricopeptide repeat-containing protein [Granulicella pectinivorans]
MKRFGWKTMGGAIAVALLAILGSVTPAQSAAQTAPGTVHGHVNNAAGLPIAKGEVKFTTDRTSEEKSRKYPFSFPLDANGDYKGEGLAPGTYLAVVFSDGKSIDFLDNIEIKSGTDKVVSFDMTRKEYMDKMTPEERKAVEEFKKKNADVSAANAKVANLNAMLGSARADIKAKNFDNAVTTMTQATAAKPDESILWVVLGDAQLGAADAAKAKGDATAVQKYKDAAASYQKGIDLNAVAKKPSPETAGAAYNQLGQALAKSGDPKAASAAYDGAAKAQPAQSGMYMFNEAATLLNAGLNDDAALAADKAIAADPKRADAYYIKGQALISKVTVDPKTQKIVAPPGCVEAYQKYLEIAPDGPHAKDVADILTGIGATVSSSYKAGKAGKK